MVKRPTAAVMHFFIYMGFVIINLEVLEIMIDGIFGSHRIFSNRWAACMAYDRRI
jgi:hypothetical protein